MWEEEDEEMEEESRSAQQGQGLAPLAAEGQRGQER